MDLFDDDSPSSTPAVDIRTDPTTSLNQLSFNKDFAQRYLHNKQRDELHQLEQKYGKDADLIDAEDDDESSSSDDETEDEDGEQLTAQIDAAVFRTLQRIRAKDASVYDPSINVFEQERAAADAAAAKRGIASATTSGAARAKTSKKLTLQDYQRQRVQELIATAEDPAAAIADATMAPRHLDGGDEGDSGDHLLPPAQEQEELRKQVSKAFHDGVDGDGDDDLFVKRTDDAAGSTSYRDSILAALGQEADESTLRAALGSLDEGVQYATDSKVRSADTTTTATSTTPADGRKAKKDKKKAAATPSLTDAQKLEQSKEDFLLDYILNQGWIDKSSDHVPLKPKVDLALLRKRQAEIKAAKGDSGGGDDDGDDAAADGADAGVATSGGAGAYGRDWEAEAAELESEASFDSKAEAFETAYNFRFEEGDEAFHVPSYARNPKDSVRREDTTRKRKREERAARKEEEKSAKLAELGRLKALKRSEIVDKLRKLKEATGFSAEDAAGLERLDLEREFDPAEHDAAMRGAFDERFYAGADEGFEPEDEEGKPVWDDDIDIDDILAEEEALQTATAGGKKGEKKAKKKAKQSGDDQEEDGEGRIEMDADFLDDDDDDGTAVAGGGNSIESLRAQLASTKLSKKDRKKLKKKLKAAEDKAARRAAQPEGSEGVEEGEMDADAPVRSSSAAAGGTSTTGSLTEAERRAEARSMIDSYYGLEYEDVIGDLPTRFKYTSVGKADYGLSPVEILLADDAQLNNVVGLKALQPYRKGKSRPIDLGRRLHQFRSELKGGRASSHANGKRKEGEGEGEGGEGEPVAKRMGKKERMRRKRQEEEAAAAAAATGAGKEGAGEEEGRASKKAKKA